MRASVERHDGRVASVMILMMVSGCLTVPERSEAYTFGESIPLGLIDVTVTGWEEVPQIHAPLTSLDPPAGEKAVAVFVRWKGLDPYREPDRQTFAERFLESRLTLQDSDGYGAEAIHAMPRGRYHFLGATVSAPRDFVVIFHVWIDSGGYTLHLEHPEPEEEGFDVATVELE